MDLAQLMKEGALSSSNSSSDYSVNSIRRYRKKSKTSSTNRSKSRSMTRCRSSNKTTLKSTSFHRSIIKPVEKKSVLKKTVKMGQNRRNYVTFQI